MMRNAIKYSATAEQATMKNSNRTSKRSTTGAALAEGVVSLWLIITATILAVGLLVNAGMSTFYKEKLGFVTNQVAVAVAAQSDPAEAEEKAKSTTRALFTAMGMSFQDCLVKVRAESIDGQPAVGVTITIKGLPLMLIGEANVFPGAITLSDKTVVLLRARAPDAYLWMSRSPALAPYVIPLHRIPPSGPNMLGVPVIPK
jgi:hypothetical protein